jgi:hypothetical protein
MGIKKLIIVVLSIIGFNPNFAQNNSKFVNTFIGTDGTGHTFPGP